VSDLAVPPASLLLSPWRPLIVAFVRKILRTLQFGPPGVFVTSWYRTPATNPGSPESQHLFALAMDLDVEPTFPFGRETQQLRDAARRAGLIAVPNLERGILHVQLFPAGVLARAGIRFPT